MQHNEQIFVWNSSKQKDKSTQSRNTLTIMKINNMSQMGTVCKLKIKTHFQLKMNQYQVQETKSLSVSNFCKQQIPIPTKTKPIKINITLEIGNHFQNGDMGFCLLFFVYLWARVRGVWGFFIPVSSAFSSRRWGQSKTRFLMILFTRGNINVQKW